MKGRQREQYQSLSFKNDFRKYLVTPEPSLNDLENQSYSFCRSAIPMEFSQNLCYTLVFRKPSRIETRKVKLHPVLLTGHLSETQLQSPSLKDAMQVSRSHFQQINLPPLHVMPVPRWMHWRDIFYTVCLETQWGRSHSRRKTKLNI